MTVQPLAKWTSSSSDREAMPYTVMARAFLDACLAWAARQSGAKTVALPTGRVDADELRQVIVALTRARGGR
jgi:hypothetical protein